MSWFLPGLNFNYQPFSEAPWCFCVMSICLKHRSDRQIQNCCKNHVRNRKSRHFSKQVSWNGAKIQTSFSALCLLLRVEIDEFNVRWRCYIIYVSWNVESEQRHLQFFAKWSTLPFSKNRRWRFSRSDRPVVYWVGETSNYSNAPCVKRLTCWS